MYRDLVRSKKSCLIQTLTENMGTKTPHRPPTKSMYDQTKSYMCFPTPATVQQRKSIRK
jgi:hypothetical protein